MSASTDKLHPIVSEVVYRCLKVVVGALKKAHILALRTWISLWYEGIQVISVRVHGVPDLLGGSSVGWLKSG